VLIQHRLHRDVLESGAARRACLARAAHRRSGAAVSSPLSRWWWS